jgi:hypothetical protein
MPTGRAFNKHEFDEAIERSAKDNGPHDADVRMKRVLKPSADQLARLLADVGVHDPAT